MRLFTGISLPPEITGNLTRLIDRLRPHAHLKWSQPYNLHITTKFIGEWPESRLKEVVGALSTISRPGSLEISFSGIGWIPNPHSPHILWVAVKGPDGLTKLAEQTDKVLQELGIAPEARPYSPHLTIARIKDPVPLAPLRKAITDLESVDFGTFTADRFHLYLSKPGPASSIYTQLAHFPLVA